MIDRETTIEQLGALVCQALKDAGIDAFLSGGAVVSIYSNNQFESFDLDFVSFADRRKIKIVMEGLGFIQDRSRLFRHPDSIYMVEFPGTALVIGDEPIREFAERVIDGKTLKLLTPTDCVKDRLAAWSTRCSCVECPKTCGRAGRFQQTAKTEPCRVLGLVPTRNARIKGVLHAQDP